MARAACPSLRWKRVGEIDIASRARTAPTPNSADRAEQMVAVRKMGPLKKLVGMVPGGMNIPDDAMETAEKRLDAWRVIIQSMTRDEIEDPKLVDSSRARRIARGSGRSDRDVKEMINQYFMMKKMMKSMKRRGGALGRGGKLPFPTR